VRDQRFGKKQRKKGPREVLRRRMAGGGSEGEKGVYRQCIKRKEGEDVWVVGHGPKKKLKKKKNLRESKGWENQDRKGKKREGATRTKNRDGRKWKTLRGTMCSGVNCGG